jgi:hypothetical protein
MLPEPIFRAFEARGHRADREVLALIRLHADTADRGQGQKKEETEPYDRDDATNHAVRIVAEPRSRVNPV